MRAISKMDHDKFFKFLQGIKASCSQSDNSIVELEKELESLFVSYQQQINEIRIVIMEYDAKKKFLSSRLKQLLRTEASSFV